MNTEVRKLEKNKLKMLLIMILAGGSIYALPYFRFSYFTPFQEALGLVGKNQAYGNLSSAYGVMNLLCYLPGGWIADRFPAKKLLVFSLISTGLLGLLLSTYPSYNIVFSIHLLWGITTVLTFWSTYIKFVNIMTDSDEQGQMFGWLEGGKGILGIIISIGGLWVYGRLGGRPQDLRYIIISIGLLCITSGILVQIYLPNIDNNEEEKVGEITAKLILRVLKLPTTWLLGLTIAGTYIFVAGTSYLNPYLETVFGLSVAASGTIAAIRSEAIKIISAPIYGNLSKKAGRSTGIIKYSFIFLIILSIGLILVPTDPKFLFIMIFIILAIGFFSYGMRGIYWAIVDELDTPKYMVGTVIGVSSIIGFLPDAFLTTLFGGIMDRNDGILGFKIIFYIFLFTAIISAIGSFISDNKVKEIIKNKERDTYGKE